MPLDLPAQTVLLLVAVVTAFTIASIGGKLIATAWTRRRERLGMAAQAEQPARPVRPMDAAEASVAAGTTPSNVADRRVTAARRRVAWATPPVSHLRSPTGSTRLPPDAPGDAPNRRHGRSIGAAWPGMERRSRRRVEDGD
jgi:hypothetical protein